jgi:4-hydroxy-4-methyl-2-oxoglutarate aldolase
MTDVSDQVARLRLLDTCAVSDALDRHGIHGVVAGLVSVAADAPLAGRAVTVLLGAPNTGGSTPARHLGAAAVDSACSDDVIVVDHQGRTDCAGWGGLLSRAAARRGVAGVVVDGLARDVGEARDFGLPVHARAATPITARGRAVEHAWGEPVELAGVPVRPGDLVLGDRNGVVVIPAEQAEQVLAAAERIAATEASMAAAIDTGTPVSDVMGKTYEELIDSGH